MITIISGEWLSLITFPGVILHEVSHRFFCDIFDVPVYRIGYYLPFTSTAGYVLHAETDNAKHAFFISAGPLIINSLACIALAFIYCCKVHLSTEFIKEKYLIIEIFQGILIWLGTSTGIHAMPSNSDVKNLDAKAKSTSGKIFLKTFQWIVRFFNMPYIGLWLRLGFNIILALLVAKLILH